jgi:hypothetical protein
MTTISRIMARTRPLLAVLLSLAIAVPALAGRKSGGSGGDVSVRGYTRKDGTYVEPYHRSAPDGDFWNNWSTKGNINPYTGKEGTKLYPPYGYGGSGYGAGGAGSGGYSYPSLSEADQHRRKARRRRQTILWSVVGAVLIYGMVQEANSSPY